MGISLVSSTENLNQATSTTSTCALTGTTAGNLLVIAGFNVNGARTISSTADTNGNTWVTQLQVSSPNGTGISASTIATGGDTTITITWSSTSGGSDAMCAEYSSTTGWPASASLNDGSCTSNGSVVTTSACATGITTTQAEELIFSFHEPTVAKTVTAGTNYTLLGAWEPVSQIEHGNYQVTTGTGTYDGTITWTGTTGFKMGAAAIKNTVAAASDDRRVIMVS